MDLGGTNTVCQLDTTFAREAYGEAGGVLHRIEHSASQPVSRLRGDESCAQADSIPWEAGQDAVVSLSSLFQCVGCRWEGYVPYGEACLLPGARTQAVGDGDSLLRGTLGRQHGVSFCFQCPNLSSLFRKSSTGERDNIRAVFRKYRRFVFFDELRLVYWSVLTQTTRVGYALRPNFVCNGQNVSKSGLVCTLLPYAFCWR